MGVAVFCIKGSMGTMWQQILVSVPCGIILYGIITLALKDESALTGLSAVKARIEKRQNGA